MFNVFFSFYDIKQKSSEIQRYFKIWLWKCWWNQLSRQLMVHFMLIDYPIDKLLSLNCFTSKLELGQYISIYLCITFNRRKPSISKFADLVSSVIVLEILLTSFKLNKPFKNRVVLAEKHIVTKLITSLLWHVGDRYRVLRAAATPSSYYAKVNSAEKCTVTKLTTSLENVLDFPSDSDKIEHETHIVPTKNAKDKLFCFEFYTIISCILH